MTHACHPIALKRSSMIMETIEVPIHDGLRRTTPGPRRVVLLDAVDQVAEGYTFQCPRHLIDTFIFWRPRSAQLVESKRVW